MERWLAQLSKNQNWWTEHILDTPFAALWYFAFYVIFLWYFALWYFAFYVIFLWFFHKKGKVLPGHCKILVGKICVRSVQSYKIRFLDMFRLGSFWILSPRKQKYKIWLNICVHKLQNGWSGLCWTLNVSNCQCT